MPLPIAQGRRQRRLLHAENRYVSNTGEWTVLCPQINHVLVASISLQRMAPLAITAGFPGYAWGNTFGLAHSQPQCTAMVENTIYPIAGWCAWGRLLSDSRTCNMTRPKLSIEHRVESSQRTSFSLFSFPLPFQCHQPPPNFLPQREYQSSIEILP